MIEDGRKTFHFNIFGDGSSLSDKLQLYKAIAGENLRGVGAIGS